MNSAAIEGPQASAKGLRHGFGVAAIEAGVPLPTIAAVLGHANIETTAIYTTAIAWKRASSWPGCGSNHYSTCRYTQLIWLQLKKKQTLKTLSNRVNDFLQANPNMPTIQNPILPEENFNRKWDQTKYWNFREKFSIYNKKINEAFEEKDHNKSVQKWRKLFGDGFGELKESDATAIITGLGITTVPPRVHATKPYASDD